MGTAQRTNNASITFNRPILGVVFNASALDASDAVLGHPTTTYTNDVGRALDLGTNTDYVRIGTDQRSVLMYTSTNSGTDDIRVILQP